RGSVQVEYVLLRGSVAVTALDSPACFLKNHGNQCRRPLVDGLHEIVSRLNLQIGEELLFVRLNSFGGDSFRVLGLYVFKDHGRFVVVLVERNWWRNRVP